MLKCKEKSLVQFFYQNIHGLTIDKFNNYYVKTFQSNEYDFICLTETWLKSADTDQFEIQNYHIINKPQSCIHPRARRGSGGLILSFENEVANFSNEGETLICGDMNARTGTLPDYVQDDNNNIPEHPPLTYIVDKEHLRTC